jgi:four helix bundle protein
MMAIIQNFEDLEIWQEARSLSLSVFLLTQKEPLSKEFRFRDQMRSAAGSVMDNIAEGFERSSRLEFINFLSIAKGSAGEVRSQLYRASDQNYITESEKLRLVEGYKLLSAKISGFTKYLNNSKHKGQKCKDRSS